MQKELILPVQPVERTQSGKIDPFCEHLPASPREYHGQSAGILGSTIDAYGCNRMKHFVAQKTAIKAHAGAAKGHPIKMLKAKSRRRAM